MKSVDIFKKRPLPPVRVNRIWFTIRNPTRGVNYPSKHPKSCLQTQKTTKIIKKKLSSDESILTIPQRSSVHANNTYLMFCVVNYSRAQKIIFLKKYQLSHSITVLVIKSKSDGDTYGYLKKKKKTVFEGKTMYIIKLYSVFFKNLKVPCSPFVEFENVSSERSFVHPLTVKFENCTWKNLEGEKKPIYCIRICLQPKYILLF